MHLCNQNVLKYKSDQILNTMHTSMFMFPQAAVKAVVASSRLGSAGSHGNPDSNKTDCSPSSVKEKTADDQPDTEQPQTQNEVS